VTNSRLTSTSSRVHDIDDVSMTSPPPSSSSSAAAAAVAAAAVSLSSLLSLLSLFTGCADEPAATTAAVADDDDDVDSCREMSPVWLWSVKLCDDDDAESDGTGLNTS